MTTATAEVTHGTMETTRPGPGLETCTGAAGHEPDPGKPETELKAAARRRGLTLKELARKMGVSASYLSGVSTGRNPWTPKLREKAMAVLGEVPGQGITYRQGGVVNGESSYIRERARELGMSMQTLADRVGVSYGYMSQVSRGHTHMGVKLQARVESALEAPARVAPEKLPCVDRRAVWDRMDALGISQNEVARRAGISTGHMSSIMNGKAAPSPGVLKRLHGVLFQRSQSEERVMPAEMQVMGWRKGRRQGMVVRGAGGPGSKAGGGAVRVGGRVPWGARVEYAFRTGYDGRGRVSTTHLVGRGCSAMLTQVEAA